MKLRALLFASAALVATQLAPAMADDNKVSIMVGGYEKQIYLPAKLTEALGYFKDEGLDVELLNEPAGVDAEDQRRSGEATEGRGPARGPQCPHPQPEGSEE